LENNNKQSNSKRVLSLSVLGPYKDLSHAPVTVRLGYLLLILLYLLFPQLNEVSSAHQGCFIWKKK